MKEYTAKYLRVTIHDNDFWYSLSLLADMLYEIFIGEGRFPEEDELPLLKKYIQPLWFSLHNLDSIVSWNKNAVGLIFQIGIMMKAFISQCLKMQKL